MGGKKKGANKNSGGSKKPAAKKPAAAANPPVAKEPEPAPIEVEAPPLAADAPASEEPAPTPAPELEKGAVGDEPAGDAADVEPPAAVASGDGWDDDGFDEWGPGPEAAEPHAAGGGSEDPPSGDGGKVADACADASGVVGAMKSSIGEMQQHVKGREAEVAGLKSRLEGHRERLAHPAPEGEGGGDVAELLAACDAKAAAVAERKAKLEGLAREREAAHAKAELSWEELQRCIGAVIVALGAGGEGGEAEVNFNTATVHSAASKFLKGANL